MKKVECRVNDNFLPAKVFYVFKRLTLILEPQFFLKD